MATWSHATDPVEVRKVLAEPQKYAGQTIYVTGNITAVCKKAGCWIKLMPTGMPKPAVKGLDTTSVFVKLTCPKDGFLVPVDSVDKKAVAYGEVVVEEISETDARHYAKDDGATDEELAAISGPQTVVRLMTPGVWVAGK